MKRKIYIKRTAAILSLIVAFGLIMGFCQEYLFANFDENRQRIKGFYLEDKNSLDVVLIGASEVYSDYSAGLAYDEFGFTSYPLATSGNTVAMFKSQLNEVLANQNPKLIAVEINGAIYSDESLTENEANIRKYLDNTPLSINKVNTVLGQMPSEDKMSYIFPIIKYHSAWNSLNNKKEWLDSEFQMRARGYSLLKGQKTTTSANKFNQRFYNKTAKYDTSTLPLTPVSEKYFKDFLDECKKHSETKIVFCRFPHCIDDKGYERFCRANEAERIIKENGFDFINLERCYDKIGIDLNQDFYNIDHMNVYGQEKLTKYLGNIFCSEYGITESTLTEAQTQKWKKSAECNRKFIELCKEKIDADIEENMTENSAILKEISS